VPPRISLIGTLPDLRLLIAGLCSFSEGALPLSPLLSPVGHQVSRSTVDAQPVPPKLSLLGSVERRQKCGTTFGSRHHSSASGMHPLIVN